jgi:hypothetical protein
MGNNSIRNWNRSGCSWLFICIPLLNHDCAKIFCVYGRLCWVPSGMTSVLITHASTQCDVISHDGLIVNHSLGFFGSIKSRPIPQRMHLENIILFAKLTCIAHVYIANRKANLHLISNFFWKPCSSTRRLWSYYSLTYQVRQLLLNLNKFLCLRIYVGQGSWKIWSWARWRCCLIKGLLGLIFSLFQKWSRETCLLFLVSIAG